MKLLECFSKQLLAGYGVSIPRGVVVELGEDPYSKIASVDLKPPLMVKAQIPIAGRGRLGGIVRVEDVDEAAKVASRLLGSSIQGMRVRLVLIEEAIEHEMELYAGVTIDRAARKPVVIASRLGGVDVEEAARKHPEEFKRIHVDVFRGLVGYEARMLAKSIGLRGQHVNLYARHLLSLYRAFEAMDAELVETNPATITSGNIVALDARIIVDDNALYRHQELTRFMKYSGEYSYWEEKARSLGLAFVELNGSVGVMGNGAGLTMATMDLVRMAGGAPANFLDIGGGASVERVRNAVRLLLEYPKARSILVNIYGGITRCDEVAKGIVEALEESRVVKPVHVRITGTRSEEGKRILEKAGVKTYDDPLEAARMAVADAYKKQG